MKEFLAQYMPPDYSAHGAELDQLNAVVHWLMLILFVIWGVLFAYMLWRFRASKQPKALYHGTHSHLSTYAEAGVAVVEVILLVGFSIPLWYRWTQRPAPDKNPLEVRVVAEQFAWNIHYPGPDGVFGRTAATLVSASNPVGIDRDDAAARDDIGLLNILTLPLGRTIVVQLSSRDVVHSFTLNEMRVKQDAVPGMTARVWFTPTQPGNWEIACSQLCGSGHYRMRGEYHVVSDTEWDLWLASELARLSR